MSSDTRKSVVLFEGSLDSPSRPSENSTVKIKMCVEHWWNNTDGETEVVGQIPAPVLT